MKKKRKSPKEVIEKLVPSWIPFWFESNPCWGMNNDKKEWEKRKSDYRSMNPHTPDNYFRKAKRCDSSLPGHNFGFRIEHRGKETLGDFFDKYGMEI